MANAQVGWPARPRSNDSSIVSPTRPRQASMVVHDTPACPRVKVSRRPSDARFLSSTGRRDGQVLGLCLVCAWFVLWGTVTNNCEAEKALNGSIGTEEGMRPALLLATARNREQHKTDQMVTS